jgi:hypothetical protein
MSLVSFVFGEMVVLVPSAFARVLELRDVGSPNSGTNIFNRTSSGFKYIT